MNPVLQAQGVTNANTSGSLTVTLPSHQANDILVLCLGFWGPNTAGSAADIPTPGGWTQFGGLNVPASGNADGKMQWFWKRAASSSETNPVCARGASWDTGTDTCFGGRAYTIRNCKTSGTPWADAQVSGPHTAANGALPAIGVTGDHSSIIQFLISLDNQAPGTIGGWTAGTDDNDATGTDCDFQTFRKEDISAGTSADASTVAAPAQGAYGFCGVSFQAQTIDITSAGAIASSEALGSPKLNLNVAGAGAIASSEGIGSPTLSQAGPQTISNAGGIASEEALGSPQINLVISGAGSIASIENFGMPRLNLSLSAAGGIASAEAIGSPQINLVISGAGAIASGEQIGEPTISIEEGTQTISGAGGIASAETFGTPVITAPDTVSSGGSKKSRRGRVGYSSFPGSAPISYTAPPPPPPPPLPPMQFVMDLGGIASVEAFGIPTLLASRSLSAAGIASEEEFGQPRFARDLTAKQKAEDATLELFIPLIE